MFGRDPRAGGKAPIETAMPMMDRGATRAGARSALRTGSSARRVPPWPGECYRGSLGTEGREGDTADDDVPESWGWTLSDAVLLQAAGATTGGSQ